MPALLPLLLSFVMVLPAEPPASGANPGAQAGSTGQPDAALSRYLGTWRRHDRVQSGQKEVEIEGYVLIRWRKGRLQVKTLDFVPSTGARVRESDWKGEIRVDSWNTTRQTFAPMPDGSLSVGLSGSNNAGPEGSDYWWASGKMWVESASNRLRLVTTDGYAGSPAGNLWQPIDYTYEKVSEDIDPRFDPRP
jgi:hypothetical protein